MQVQKPRQGYKLVKSLFGKYEEIPENWELKKFGDLFRLEYGEGLTESNRSNEGFPVYGSGGIIGYHSKFLAKGPGLIIARKGSLGNTFFEQNNFFSIDTVYYISQEQTKENLEFSYYLISNLKLENYKIATAQPGINRDDVYSIEVKRPPIHEQQKIVSILSNVDSLICQIQKEIELTQKLKKGLMKELLTRGIGHIRFKKVHLGFGKTMDFPVEWNIEKLKDNTSKIGSGITPLGGSEVYKDNGIPLIRSQNVHFNELRLDNVAYITNKIHDEMRNTKLKPNDVLLNITGASIGRCTVIPNGFGEGNVNQHVCIIRTTSSLHYLFLNYFLSSSLMQKLINSVQGGLSRQGLNFKDLGNFLIPIPKINEQQKIASILSNVDSKIQKQQEYKSKLENLKKGLMQKLLTGQIRVKV